MMDEKITFDEGDRRIKTEVCCRQTCRICGAAANYRATYLLPNARTNPVSSGYGKDDISWYSDGEAFFCSRHKNEQYKAMPGMKFCASFPDHARFSHMFIWWEKVKIEYQYTCRKCGEPAQLGTDPPMCTRCMAEAGGENDPETAKEE